MYLVRCYCSLVSHNVSVPAQLPSDSKQMHCLPVTGNSSTCIYDSGVLLEAAKVQNKSAQCCFNMP